MLKDKLEQIFGSEDKVHQAARGLDEKQAGNQAGAINRKSLTTQHRMQEPERLPQAQVVLHQDRMLRIAVFIDGSFFLKVNAYYRYGHPVKTNLAVDGFINLLVSEIAERERCPVSSCKVIESHWFRGRFSTQQLKHVVPDESRFNQQILNDRQLDDILMYNGFKQHVYPLQVDSATGKIRQKGIDVWLALEVFDLVMTKGFDVLILVAGDTDFVPLVRKITSVGTRVMIPAWNYQFEDKKGKIHNSHTSQLLLKECSYPVYFDDLIDDPDRRDDRVVTGLFHK